MPSKTEALSNELVGHLRYLEFTRKKLEILLMNGDVVLRDVNQVYIGLYLEVMTSFERFIEDLFFGLLSGKFRDMPRSVKPFISITNKQTLRNIVLAGQNYATWFPYNNTENKARLFFREGLPFTMLNPTDKDLIIECLRIRNAMAHKSRYALSVFERNVLANKNLMSKERTPVGYLRSEFRVSPRQTRYEYYLGRIADIARKLCA